ncbi:hypothetical protein ACPPVU_11885 [Mucilaginibacter sp. McL0603]|uniref:hypothetical protein n=1 Tax=Mucilaginibacter sp. McL0603 TaxID=3415670 RepID=UPI003CF06F9C
MNYPIINFFGHNQHSIYIKNDDQMLLQQVNKAVEQVNDFRMFKAPVVMAFGRGASILHQLAIQIRTYQQLRSLLLEKFADLVSSGNEILSN